MEKITRIRRRVASLKNIDQAETSTKQLKGSRNDCVHGEPSNTAIGSPA